MCVTSNWKAYGGHVLTLLQHDWMNWMCRVPMLSFY